MGFDPYIRRAISDFSAVVFNHQPMTISCQCRDIRGGDALSEFSALSGIKDSCSLVADFFTLVSVLLVVAHARRCTSLTEAPRLQ